MLDRGITTNYLMPSTDRYTLKSSHCLNSTVLPKVVSILLVKYVEPWGRGCSHRLGSQPSNLYLRLERRFKVLSEVRTI